jgi:glycosyltransferase involved in cell wall biosynthesis
MGIKNAVIKTITYAKRNGVGAAFFAALERVSLDANENYEFHHLSEDVLKEQNLEYRRFAEEGETVNFSIVVPMYNTPEEYLREMIESVIAQSYANWELVLADASQEESKIAKEYAGNDPRIKYYHLEKNAGISENTNRAIEFAKGDYIGLLDHDDLITPDALYEAFRVIKKSMKQNHLSGYRNCPIRLIYSDEDKFDDNNGEKRYYEHHAKPSFNMDYLFSNNYICHFTIIRSDIIKRLKLRAKYDGAQDFDLFLRTCCEAALSMDMASWQIAHISKVLYHWRCHSGSTAANPASKTYAYEAGQHAIEAALSDARIDADVTPLPHLGFYRVNYKPDILSCRKDIGCVGGKLVDEKKKIAGGIYLEDKTALYKGIPLGYSGGLQHRAVVQQDCYAVDIRCMAIRPEFVDAYEEVTGMKYTDTFNENGTEERFVGLSEEKIIELSFLVCKEVRKRGLRIMWDPQVVKRI